MLVASRRHSSNRRHLLYYAFGQAQHEALSLDIAQSTKHRVAASFVIQDLQNRTPVEASYLMASDQAPVSAATPLISGGIPELGSVNPIPGTSQSNIEAPNIKSLKRNRPEQLLSPSGVTTIANTGLTASPSPKSPRYTGSFSPRLSPAPLTGAAALEDERRRKEDQQKSASSAMSENPSHKALSSLIAGGGAAMSKPQDASIATTSMSGAMSTVANAISIPSPLHYDEKSETSPASVTSLASLGSTAQTATASTTAAASPATALGPPDKEPRDSQIPSIC